MLAPGNCAPEMVTPRLARKHAPTLVARVRAADRAYMPMAILMPRQTSGRLAVLTKQNQMRRIFWREGIGICGGSALIFDVTAAFTRHRLMKWWPKLIDDSNGDDSGSSALQ